MQFLGTLVILGFGGVHLALGIVLLATGYRTLRRELLPRLAEARPGPLNAALSILGGVGWTVVVAAFCFLVASRTVQMAF
ncbi:MAG TPA: hypothetical protein VD886_12625 [Herpetosiphonaceae bacterium]|nr:hypothetical protein [Herpetosiphonaceae bacterium]